MKKLIYYCIGYNSKYNKMLELSIFSLKLFYSDDILIITDYNNCIELKQNEIFKNVKFMIVDNALDVFNSSLNRYRIFEYDFILEYDIALYLDCDTLIINNLNFLFEKTLNENCVGVAQERNKKTGNYDVWNFNISNENYDISYLSGCFLYYDNIEKKALNSGVFSFPINEKSKNIFNSIYKHGIENHNDEKIKKYNNGFGDQPYLNYHLYKNSYFFLLDDIYLVPDFKNINLNLNTKDYDNENFKKHIIDYSILHFYGPSWGSFDIKMNNMLCVFPKKIKKYYENCSITHN